MVIILHKPIPRRRTQQGACQCAARTHDKRSSDMSRIIVVRMCAFVACGLPLCRIICMGKIVFDNLFFAQAVRVHSRSLGARSLMIVIVPRKTLVTTVYGRQWFVCVHYIVCVLITHFVRTNIASNSCLRSLRECDTFVCVVAAACL